MRLPYREPSPPPPEEPEAEEPYAKVLRGQQRRARITMLILGGTLGALVVAAAARPAPAQTSEHDVAKIELARRTRARDAIATARARAAETQERFAVDVRAAVAAGVGPRPELGACPITLAQPTGIAGRAFPLVIVERSDVDALRVPSQAIADVLGDIRRAEEHLASGRYEEAALYADALDHPGRLVVDVVIVEDTHQKPSMKSDTSFVPGELTGRAYLYDFAAHHVACAADVHTKSSKAIGYAYAIDTKGDTPAARGRSASLEDAIMLDFRRQIETTVAIAMVHRAGP